MKIQVFIAWSGQSSRSHIVAEVLRKWLEVFLHMVNPYISDDIAKGDIWDPVLIKELSKSRVGLICLTPENINNPWIMFEAGIIANRMRKESYVCPYLIGFESARHMNKFRKNPLSRFQLARVEEKDTRKLFQTLNSALGPKLRVNDKTFDLTFNKWWPELKAELDEALRATDTKKVQRTKKPVSKAKSSAPDSKRKTGRTEKIIEKGLLNKYGLKAFSSTVSVEILDLHGKARLRRTYEGIKVTSTVPKRFIPGQAFVGTPDSQFIRYPALVKPVRFKKELKLVTEQPIQGICNFRVEIKGGLKSSDPELDYAYQSLVSKGFLMTRREVEEEYADSLFKEEYISGESELPMDKLTVEVIFPKGFKVKSKPGVFKGKSEIEDKIELERVKFGFEIAPHYARFTIENPLVGYTYLISWMPPK